MATTTRPIATAWLTLTRASNPPVIHAIATQTTIARNVGTKANTTAANSTEVARS